MSKNKNINEFSTIITQSNSYLENKKYLENKVKIFKNTHGNNTNLQDVFAYIEELKTKLEKSQIDLSERNSLIEKLQKNNLLERNVLKKNFEKLQKNFEKKKNNFDKLQEERQNLYKKIGSLEDTIHWARDIRSRS